jgi:eukaryotic-like serine/threonine-protein kinase
MNCVKCGVALDQGTRFCPECGTQQPGAVVPSAAVRTGAKTMFQGGSGAKPHTASKPIHSADAVAKTLAGAPPADVLAARASAAQKVSSPAPAPSSSSSQPAQSPPARAVAPRPKTMPMDQIPQVVETDLTGQTLNNRYAVEEKIGEGGFGAVYRARQTQMNRVVALKVLHARMAKDPQVIGRFRREAQASSLLRAPHTVQVYDFDQTPEGVMYLAMEMLQGESLHAVLHDAGTLEPVRVARILDGIAESLGEAHGHGIVHRDIKPENIFLEPRPSADFVKVLDFGIAKIVTGDGGNAGPALTAVGQTLGTLEYMSPEQLMGQQLDGRSDLYAIGVLAYEMLTGGLPFPAKTPGEMITGHLKVVPKPPSTTGKPIPPLLDQIVIRLLEKNRDVRYRDAAELRADLARVIAGETAARGAALAATAAAPPPAAANYVQPLPAVPQNAPGIATGRAMPVPSTPVPGGGMTTNMILLIIGVVVGVAAIVGGILFFAIK